MYKITLTLENPVTGDRSAMVYQFDPPTLTQTKWDTAFPAVRAALDALISSATVKEPPTW
jgi:hypothetical protein